MTGRALLCGAVLVAALAGQLWFWNGGVLEMEATAFIPQYTAGRPAASKIFDPHLNDFDAYQARELSYVFDYGDAAFHVWIARTFDISLFVPLSAVLTAAVITIVVVRGVSRTMPAIGAFATAAVLGVFFSSFQFASTIGVYYRSSKVLLAAVLVTWLFHARRSIEHPRASDGVITGLLCVVAGLLDRQGFFYACVALLFFAWRRQRTPVSAASLRGVVIAILLLVLYNVAIAPAIIHVLNGYWPDFDYQRRSLRSIVLLWHPEYVVRAIGLLFENGAVLLGGAVVSSVLVAAVAASFLRVRRAHGSFIVIAAFGLTAQIVMFAMMIHQHPPIDQFVDHRLWYYSLPFCMTIMFAVLCWLNAIAPSLSRTQARWVQVALAVVVVANVVQLSAHRQVMATGPYFQRIFAQSAVLQRSLAADAPEPALDDVYREYFENERRFRGR